MRNTVVAYVSLDIDRAIVENLEGTEFDNIAKLKEAFENKCIVMSLSEHFERLNDEQYTEGCWCGYYKVIECK